MWRLVAGGVLSGYAHTVDVVVHQCRYGIRRRCAGVEYHQFGRIGLVPHNQLFAPITEEVCLQTGCRLGVVGGLCVVVGGRVERDDIGKA